MYGGWGNTPNTIVSLTDPNNAAITLAPNFKPTTSDAHTDATHWYNYTGYFVATLDGDYKLNFNKVESGQQQIAIGDIDLRTASELEFADNASVPTYAPGTYPSVKITRTLIADKWATAVYPFAVSGVDNIAVLNSYDAEKGELGFTSADASTANVPFLMRSATDKTTISLSNVAVAAAAATDATVDEASLKGTYAATNIDAGTNVKNYVLSNNTIYVVGENAATINPYRAYIQIAQPTTARLRFVIDGEEATGIESIAAETGSVLNGQVYDLSGRLVKNPTKGLYIVNGKKVLVK